MRKGRGRCLGNGWAHMRLALALLVVSFAVGHAWAGGNYVQGRVSEFAGADGAYTFRFQQTEEVPALMTDCLTFTVSVQYARVPWFSWLPLVRTSHPTRAETDAASAALGEADREQRVVNFGYMGYGLVPAGEHCSFATKGLRLIKDGNNDVVLAFHDET